MAKLHLITYGCQMNEYDSERVAGLLKRERYELTDRPEEADLILLNTCSIREKAEDKVFSQLGALRLLKRRRPDLTIGVMGCMAQLQKGRIQERAPYVDLVFGSPAIARVAELVERARAGRGPVLETGEGALVKITARPDGGRRLKAFVTVMEGCEKFCTFCVVPTTRGRERSHAPTVIVEEIRGLAAAGCREVTLLGQTVNAYGRDLSPPTDLADLLERVNDIDGIERIRFTTSNPYNLTPRLIRAIRDVPKVCEYLHLPLQSGSDRVLERMNRGYTRARYLELIAELQETVPDLALSTDLIVGFPGETDEDFAR
ncbi:MAG TPA: tRNA (N6-isopentenyl adenosine(37)-C2)-methylthiotransferase MiaB, partial [Methylomirabilota bacterium]|nr:tRNA (N6-isopentenyl adenosine(37)-C2)-methylthiotransferase MiaB [Methylomirabilota bacterium]